MPSLCSTIRPVRQRCMLVNVEHVRHTVELGQTRSFGDPASTSGLPQVGGPSHVSFLGLGSANRHDGVSLDHLVGNSEHGWRNGEAERPYGRT